MQPKRISQEADAASSSGDGVLFGPQVLATRALEGRVLGLLPCRQKAVVSSMLVCMRMRTVCIYVYVCMCVCVFGGPGVLHRRGARHRPGARLPNIFCGVGCAVQVRRAPSSPTPTPHPPAALLSPPP